MHARLGMLLLWSTHKGNILRAPLRLGNGLRGTDRLSNGDRIYPLEIYDSSFPFFFFFLHLLDAILVTVNMKVECVSIMSTCGKWEAQIWRKCVFSIDPEFEFNYFTTQTLLLHTILSNHLSNFWGMNLVSNFEFELNSTASRSSCLEIKWARKFE